MIPNKCRLSFDGSLTKPPFYFTPATLSIWSGLRVMAASSSWGLHKLHRRYSFLLGQANPASACPQQEPLYIHTARYRPFRLDLLGPIDDKSAAFCYLRTVNVTAAVWSLRPPNNTAAVTSRPRGRLFVNGPFLWDPVYTRRLLWRRLVPTGL